MSGCQTQGADEDDSANDKEPNLIGWLIGILLFAGIIWGGGGFSLLCYRSGNTAIAGQTADAMGVTNGLFSAVAVGLVALSIYFQTKELRAQREQLKLQRVELKLTRTEMEMARKEQEKAADALQEQVELARMTATVAALASVSSAMAEASPNKRYLWDAYHTDRDRGVDVAEEWGWINADGKGLDYRVGAYLLELEEHVEKQRVATGGSRRGNDVIATSKRLEAYIEGDQYMLRDRAIRTRVTNLGPLFARDNRSLLRRTLGQIDSVLGDEILSGHALNAELVSPDTYAETREFSQDGNREIVYRPWMLMSCGCKSLLVLRNYENGFHVRSDPQVVEPTEY